MKATAYLTVRQTAERLSCSVRSVYRMVEAREVGSMRVGRAIRIPEADVEAYERTRSQHVATLTTAQKRRTRAPLVTGGKSRKAS